MMPESTERAALGQFSVPKEGFRCGEGGGGAEETAVYGLAYTVDSYVIDALLVEGPVDPGRNVPNFWCEEFGRWIVPELEAPLVHGRREGRLLLLLGLGGLLGLDRSPPPPTRGGSHSGVCPPLGWGGAGLLRPSAGPALGGVGGGWGAIGIGGSGDA